MFGKWIPVSEDLPIGVLLAETEFSITKAKRSDWYLVLYKNGTVGRLFY